MKAIDLLEERCAALEEALARVKEDVRLRRIALEFPAVQIRPGDSFQTESGTLGRLHSIDSDGDWNYTLDDRGWSGIGPYQPERLFTRAEVEAIVGEALERRNR